MMYSYAFMADTIILLLANLVINLASLTVSVLAIRKSNATNKTLDQLNLRLDYLLGKNYGTKL